MQQQVSWLRAWAISVGLHLITLIMLGWVATDFWLKGEIPLMEVELVAGNAAAAGFGGGGGGGGGGNDTGEPVTAASVPAAPVLPSPTETATVDAAEVPPSVAAVEADVQTATAAETATVQPVPSIPAGIEASSGTAAGQGTGVPGYGPGSGGGYGGGHGGGIGPGYGPGYGDGSGDGYGPGYGGSTGGKATAARIQPPQILEKVNPKYPEQARQEGVEGIVRLRIEILANGRPGQISVVESSGDARLDAAAMEAVAKWRFIPARDIVTGTAVRCYTTLPVAFKLQ